MENVFEILKDLPKPGDYVLLTVAKGSAAGEKAILAEKKIIWESKENGFFSAHFSEAGDLKKCGLYEIREQQVFCDIIGGQEHLVICGGGHVSVPVIKIGIMLGWKVTVLEDRPQFADHARNAGATEVICQPFEDAVCSPPARTNHTGHSHRPRRSWPATTGAAIARWASGRQALSPLPVACKALFTVSRRREQSHYWVCWQQQFDQKARDRS